MTAETDPLADEPLARAIRQTANPVSARAQFINREFNIRHNGCL